MNGLTKFSPADKAPFSSAPLPDRAPRHHTSKRPADRPSFPVPRSVSRLPHYSPSFAAADTALQPCIPPLSRQQSVIFCDRPPCLPPKFPLYICPAFCYPS